MRSGGGVPGGRAGGFGRVALKAEQPETLPWLISFDTFVDGRRFQGHEEVAGMGGGGAVLNEALALDLLRSAGEVTRRSSYTTFTVNDRPATARLLVEHPDGHFAERFTHPGVLYKALSTSRFTDQGDDPVDYQDDFKQITGKGTWDLQPVIDLIRWVGTATDADFDRDLARHVEVGSFARYIAMQNLMLNFDDMAGPGHNSYLWFDIGTGRFSVVAWDHNLTFTGSADQGPYDHGGSMGGRLGGHRLKERALASPTFRPVYERAVGTHCRPGTIPATRNRPRHRRGRRFTAPGCPPRERSRTPPTSASGTPRRHRHRHGRRVTPRRHRTHRSRTTSATEVRHRPGRRRRHRSGRRSGGSRWTVRRRSGRRCRCRSGGGPGGDAGGGPAAVGVVIRRPIGSVA